MQDVRVAIEARQRLRARWPPHARQRRERRRDERGEQRHPDHSRWTRR
jgi:hypothetical protein